MSMKGNYISQSQILNGEVPFEKRQSADCGDVSNQGIEAKDPEPVKGIQDSARDSIPAK